MPPPERGGRSRTSVEPRRVAAGLWHIARHMRPPCRSCPEADVRRTNFLLATEDRTQRGARAGSGSPERL